MGFLSEPLVVTAEIIVNRSRIIGSQQNGPEYLYEALDYVAKGKVKVIAETYSLDDIARAYENVADGNVRFRAVIKNHLETLYLALSILSYSNPEFRNRLLSKFPYSEYFQLQNIYEQGKRSKKDKLKGIP
jgi:hypothetical protein